MVIMVIASMMARESACRSVPSSSVGRRCRRRLRCSDFVRASSAGFSPARRCFPRGDTSVRQLQASSILQSAAPSSCAISAAPHPYTVPLGALRRGDMSRDLDDRRCLSLVADNTDLSKLKPLIKQIGKEVAGRPGTCTAHHRNAQIAGRRKISPNSSGIQLGG